MNKKRPAQLSYIEIKEFLISPTPLKLVGIRILDCCTNQQLIFDLDFVYNGEVQVIACTEVLVNTPIVK